MNAELAGGRRWIVSQIGSRQHYAVARAMAQCGRLDRLYTDIWVRQGRAMFERAGGPLRSLAGRFHPDVPADRVVSFNLGAIRRLLRDRSHAAGPAGYLRFLETGQWFGSRVAHALQSRSIDPDRSAALLFNTGALETIDLLRQRGVPTLVDQIDVARVEEAIVREETVKWPGWEQLGGAEIPDKYFERLEREWAAADGVVVNSNWTRDGLVRQGVPAAKIHVVPLAYESTAPSSPPPRDPPKGRPLRVLWLGQVILRKGLPYLFEAARKLGSAVEVDLVGWIGVTDKALAAAPANVHIVGPVPRAAVQAYYQKADVFVLPTMSDGFAITQLEAMSHGLPVIATPRCGEVVIDGVNGRFVAAGDSASLATTLGELAANPDLMAAMSASAIERVKSFTLARFAERLAEAGEQVISEIRASR